MKRDLGTEGRQEKHLLEPRGEVYGVGASSEADGFYIQSVLNKTWPNSQGKDSMGICAEFPIFGRADFKIKGCFYNKRNIRGTWKNYSKATISWKENEFSVLLTSPNCIRISATKS